MREIDFNWQNHSLFQIEVFLHYLGTNSFFHVLRDARGPSTHTVCRVVHRVSEAINSLQKDIICWPTDCRKLAKEFFDLGGFPSTAGCLDGTHVKITPPKEDEVSYVNRHHEHSLNVLAVCGPDLSIFYLNANYPGPNVIKLLCVCKLQIFITS